MGGYIHHAPAKPATKNNRVIFTGFHILDPGNDLIDVDRGRLPFSTRGIGNSGLKSGKTHACVFRERGELFYGRLVDIDSQGLNASHFAAFPVDRVEAVDYPATRPADPNGNYPHTTILLSMVMFRMKVLIYYVRSVFNIL
jgi:hypothetical protein